MSEILLTNTAAGGVVGSAVTKTNQPAGNGDPFDVVHVDSASSLTYSADAPPGHTQAYSLVRGGGSVVMQWNAALAAFGPSPEFVAELWLKVPAARPEGLGATVLARGYASTDATFADRSWELIYDYLGRLKLRDPAGHEALCRTPIRLGKWYRVLVQIIAGTSATMRVCEEASTVTHSRGTSVSWGGGATVGFEYRANSSQMLGEVLHGPVRVGRGTEMLVATTVGHEAPLVSAGLPLLAVEPGQRTPLAGTAEAIDAPIDVYSWRRISGRGGALRGDGARRVYRPGASLTGYVETFAFKVTDAAGYDSDEVTVTHEVLPTSDRTGAAGGGDVAVLPTVEPPTGYVPPADPTPDPEPEPEPENVPPVPDFTVDAPDLTAAFDASGSSDVDGVVTAWAWDFGDGATATGTITSHTYAAAGSYLVKLTVTDDDGASASISRSLTVEVPVVPPSASFTESVSSQTVSVDGSSSSDPAGGVIVSYAWDFGDGSAPVVGSSPTASYTYAVGNTNYDVALTVTDDEGATDTVTHTVTVGIVDTERPSAVPNLRQTETPIAGAVVAWDPATDNVAINYYRLRLSTNGGSDVYLTQTKDLTYTLENLDPSSSYEFTVEAYDTSKNIGPRTRLPLTVLAEAPPLAFEQIAPLDVRWHPENATTAPDTTDPTLTRVQSVDVTPGTYGAVISHGTEASQPFLVALEDGRQVFRYDGVNDRLLRSSTGILRNLPGFTIGVRFRAEPGFDGLRSLVVHSAERAYLALIDGKLRVGGSRVTPTGTQTAYFFGDVDLRSVTEWHDIVAKYDLPTDRFKLWLDGVLTIDEPYVVEAAGVNSSDNSGTINLGSWNGTGSDPFAGDIEQAVVYRSELTDAQAVEVGRTLRGGSATVVEPEPDPTEPDPNEPEPEPELPLEPVPGDLALEFVAGGLQAGPVASWAPTVGDVTVAQATLANQPTREVIAGRAAVTFAGSQWLFAGTNAIGRAWPGVSVYAVLWLANGHHWHQHVAAWNDSKGQRFGARLVSGRGAVSARRSTSGDSHRTTVGVDDLGGAWHFVGWHYDTETGTARVTVDGKLDHETGLPWSLGATTSDVASTIFALGSSKTSGAGEPLKGSLNRLRVYKGAHTVEQARSVMNDVGFVPATPATAPWTATMSTDPRDVYRARLTVSEEGTYQLRHSQRTRRQVQQFTGTSLFVPFLDPGAHHFAVRKMQPDGTWSVWKVLPVWTARDHPDVLPGVMRWAMPAAWGVTQPITTIRLRSGQSGLTISRDGHYRILPPLESVDSTTGAVLPAGLMETNRFDLNIGNSADDLTEVLIHVEGGEFHSTPDARINVKSRATCSKAWLYMQIDGVDFTGGNAGDTLQLSWNEVSDGTLVVQNSHGEQITWGGVEHSDTQQLYAGPNTWKCDGWDAASDYQGFILYPAQFGRFVDLNPGYVTTWPMSRIRIHQATRTTKTEGVTTAGTPFYSWHHPLTGAPWFDYDKTPGGPHGLYVTRDEKTPNGNISWQYVNPETWELSTKNHTPGHWDGVQLLPQGATPPQMLLTGSAAPGRNFVNPGYSPTPPPPA